MFRNRVQYQAKNKGDDLKDPSQVAKEVKQVVNLALVLDFVLVNE